MTEFNAGDHARVTIEYRLDGDWSGENIQSAVRTFVDANNAPDATITVENIGKKVETFRPGDIVRHIQTGKQFGILDHGDYFSYAHGRILGDARPFTSEYYELVLRPEPK